MGISQETLVGVRTYRYSLSGWTWNLVRGAVFAVCGCLLLMRDYDNAGSGPLMYLAFGIGFILGAAYLAISAARSVVCFDRAFS
jgi:hypothetical protein